MTTIKSSKIQTSQLQAENGLNISLLNYGATLQSLQVPTANGPVEVLLTYANTEDYLDDTFCLGSTVGRYAGRIGSPF